MKLLKIRSSGGGALMVRRWVFDRIGKELKESPFGRRPGKSEDMSFFDRLAQLQMPAWCDVRTEAPPPRVTPVTEGDEDMGGYQLSEKLPVEGFMV